MAHPLNSLIAVLVMAAFSNCCLGNPVSPQIDGMAKDDPLDLPGLVYIGKTGNKELYITDNMVRASQIKIINSFS